MTLLAIDPGLASCGAAIFDPGNDLVDADVFTSKPRKKPSGFRGAWAATDLGRRAGELATWMRDLLDRCELIGGGLGHVVIESNVGGRSATAVYQMAMAAGVIRCAVSEALPPDRILYTTAETWREALGFTPTKRPRGATKAERNRIKREDDERLYDLLERLPDGNRVRELVAAHGGRDSQSAHPLDAFGIGRWLLSASGADRFSVAA